MRTSQSLARLGTFAAFIGAFLLFVGTLLHPAESDPNVPVAAFTEYAANTFWVWSHLMQFAGVLGLSLEFVAFVSTLESGRPVAWARLGLVGTIAIIAVGAALQAVDGVALKAMVDRWAAATGDVRAITFEAAFAVRQIEIGLASLLSILLGFTLTALSLAILFSARYPSWLGWIGLLNSFVAILSGATQASTGFSAMAMALSMPSSIVLLVWAITVGVLMWRLASHLPADNTAG